MYDYTMSGSPTDIGDAGPLDPIDIESGLADVAGVLNVQHARLSRIVERALVDDEWQGEGIHSPAQWLAWQSGLSLGRAREIVRIARRRAEFPMVSAAFDRGELAVDQVAAVMRAPAWADELVLDFARAATVQQLRRTMRSEFFEHDPDEPRPEPSGDDRDRLSTGATEAGRWRINGELDLDRGGIVEAAMTEAKDSLFERGHIDATWADALVEVCQRSLDAIASPARRDRFKIWVHLDATSGRTSTTMGWRLPDTVRDHVLCDGQVQPVWEREGVAFNVGRSQRTVPDRTRRVVERRDRGCRAPGCSHERFVEVHHIIHWLDDGPTDTWNLICLCPKHHRMHHQGRLGVVGNADDVAGVVFTDWKGRVLDPSGRPHLPTGPPPKPTMAYRHPVGERLDTRWVGLGWVHPNALERRRQAARDRRPDSDPDPDRGHRARQT